MANVLIEENTMSAIGDAIREKTGKTDLILPKDMPTEIAGIEGGSDGQEMLGALIDKSITEVSSNITTIGPYAFHSCTSLTTVNLPAATTIGQNAFRGCTSLTTIDLPAATTIGSYVFHGCTSLTTVNLPAVTFANSSILYSCTSLTTVNLPAATTIDQYVFRDCTSLTTIDLPAATYIGQDAFRDCTSLTTVNLPAATTIGVYAFRNCGVLSAIILRNVEQICSLSSTNALATTPVATGTGYIYAPSALIEDYKAATNWSTYAAQFRALEDYTVDGTITGELDETKI